MGLLDMFNDPQSAGLLSAGAQILERSGDTSRPYGIGQAVGTGINSYMQTNQAMQVRKRQEEQERQMQAMREMQMQEMQAEVEKRQAANAYQLRVEEAYKNMPTSGPQQDMAARQSHMGGDLRPTIENAAKLDQMPQQSQRSMYDQLMAQAQYFQSKGLAAEAKNAMKEAADVRPKFNTTPQRLTRNGKDGMFLINDYGDVQDTGMEAAPEMVEMKLGNRTEWVDKNRVKAGQQYQIGVDPDTVYNGAITRRGQDLVDSRSREMADITRKGNQTQIINDPVNGPLLIDKGTGNARQAIGMDGQPIRGEQTIKKEKQAQGLVSVIDSAEKLLGGATGSYFGAGIDKAAQFIGTATDGAENIAQLKVLEGSIMMNQPRMEGPQSDKDVALYRQMAGQIGDPTVPAALKKVALQSIKEINQRYAGGAPQQSAPQAAQPMRKSVLKGQVIDGYRFKGGDPSDQNNWELK